MNNSSVVNWQHTRQTLQGIPSSSGIIRVRASQQDSITSKGSYGSVYKVTKCDYIACMQRWHICKGIIVCMYFMLFERSELHGK